MADGTPIIVKKKKSHGHAHHGGSWKVAYADFVTAMMAFFMVMWIMGLSTETKSMIQGYFNDPLGFTKNEPKSRVNIQPTNGSQYSMAGKKGGQGQREISTEKQAAEGLKKSIEKAVAQSAAGSAEEKAISNNLVLTVTDEGLEVELTENSGVVFFELGSSVIRPVAKKLIDRVAPILAKSGRKMLIDGHTDARHYPSAHYDNWDLSNDRARAIRQALKSGGVQEKQILAIRAFAATRLKNGRDPFHFSNRRVTVLLPFDQSGESSLALPKDIIQAEVQAAFKDDLPDAQIRP